MKSITVRSKKKKKTVTFEEGDALGSVDRQAQDLKLKLIASSNKAPDSVRFYVNLKGRNPEGLSPIVVARGLRTGRSGKTGRGLATFDYRIGNTDHVGVKLAVGASSVAQADMVSLMNKVLDKLVAEFNPVKRSSWYSSRFSDLTDGTKVFVATSGIGNLEHFTGITIEDATLEYQNPGKVYVPFLTKKDEEEFYYFDALTSNNKGKILCIDTNGKPMGEKKDDALGVIYPKQGIEFIHPEEIKKFVNSKFYKSNWWSIDAVLRLSELELKCVQTGRHQDSGNPIYTIIPLFKWKFAHSVALRLQDQSELGEILDEDERGSLFEQVLFGDIPLPKKRKTKASVDAKPKKKKKKEQEEPIEVVGSTQELSEAEEESE